MRTFQSGKHGNSCAALLRDLLVPRNCLRAQTSRIAYERSLRADLSHQSRLTAAVTKNSKPPSHSSLHTHFKPQPYLQQDAELKHAESSTVSQMEDSFKFRKTSVRKRTHSKKRKQNSAMSEMIERVFGGITAVLICYVVFRWFISIEPETFEVYQEKKKKIID